MVEFLSIEEQWQNLYDALDLSKMCETQQSEMKNAFYAGVMSLFEEFKRASRSGIERDVHGFLDGIGTELKEWQNKL